MRFKIIVNRELPRNYKIEKFVRVICEDEFKRLSNSVEKYVHDFDKHLISEGFEHYTQQYYNQIVTKIRPLVYDTFLSQYKKVVKTANKNCITFSNSNLKFIINLFDINITEILKMFDYIFTEADPTDATIGTFKSELWGIRLDLINEFQRQSEIYMLSGDLRKDPKSVLISKLAVIISVLSFLTTLLLGIFTLVFKKGS